MTSIGGRLGGGLGGRFWRVWTAATVSGLGSGTTAAALPLLAAAYSRDPRRVAVVAAAGYLPLLLLGLHTGVLADRLDRRRIMWGTDVARAGLTALLCGLVLLGRGGTWSLAALALALGAADILFENAATAVVPMLVPRERLGSAQSWLQGAQAVTLQLLGLPLGGALFVAHPALPFGVDAASFAVAVALVAALRGTYRAERAGPRTTVTADLREGAAWLWRHRELRLLAGLLGVLNGAYALVEATLVLFAVERLHVGRFGYTLLLAVLAVGGIAGSVVAQWVARRLGVTWSVRLALLVPVVVLALPGLVPTVPATVVAMLLGGLAGMVWNVVTITLRARLVPGELLGRVTSAYRVVGLGVMPVAAGAGGLVAHAAGLRAPWLVAGAALALATVLGWQGLARLAALDPAR